MDIEKLAASTKKDIDEVIKPKMSRIEKYKKLREDIEAENKAAKEDGVADYIEELEMVNEELEEENFELKVIITGILKDIYLG